jgi:hypothetical protein
MVAVDNVVCRGYVHLLSNTLRVRHPHNEFRFINYGEGSATSRDVLAAVERTAGFRYNVAVIEMGTNDVLRGVQHRHAEAVSIGEFTANYGEVVRRAGVRR